MLKGIESTIFLFIGTAVGILSSNLAFLSKFGSAYTQDPIFLAVGGGLILIGRLFPTASSKLIANVWGGAYAAYISVPVSKWLTGNPMGKEQTMMLYLSLAGGFVISWYLFRRAEAPKKSKLI